MEREGKKSLSECVRVSLCERERELCKCILRKDS